MHEMGIAASIWGTVEKELAHNLGSRISKVGLHVGEFAGLDTESLRFCFEAICLSSYSFPIELEITWCCVADGRSGEELDLAYLELEELTPQECTREVTV